MMVPSIDIMNGSTVQLVGGREKKIDAGDPRAIAERFGLVGEIAVIDLDAAIGQGSNADLIRDVLPLARCRVGGGIRDLETARMWLDAGAEMIILGTAATPELLSQLPRERVIAALDAHNNDVVVEGWRTTTGRTVESCIDELRPYVDEFLITFVEREGQMVGLPIDRVENLVRHAAPARVTVAGGVRSADEIAQADRVGADVQVGMALYSGAFDLADGFCAPLTSDRPDGLWPTIVEDVSGAVLGLTYSSQESVREAIARQRGVYFSRSRDQLWIKGESSGDTQELLSIATDCDRDALRFTVRQLGGGFCHTGTSTCFGASRGIAALQATLQERAANAPAGSYTRRLLDDGDLLRSKLCEEAAELAEADEREDVVWECADVVYFMMVAATRAGVRWDEIERALDDRARRVTRRPGNAKPVTTERVS